VNGEWIDIVAPSREHAERLAAALPDEFTGEVQSDGTFAVRVTPDSETAAKLVALFNAIGQWLSEGQLTSCDVKFGERSLAILPATQAEPSDPTAFLIERTRQLEQALTSRIVIEQAKGILAERHGLEVERAFEMLKGGARSTRRNIHDVAADVVSGKERL
jgi:hypothetical protein